jgi:hypothetical protein
VKEKKAMLDEKKKILSGVIEKIDALEKTYT